MAGLLNILIIEETYFFLVTWIGCKNKSQLTKNSVKQPSKSEKM